MLKSLYVFGITCFLMGCPIVYDPPTGELNILNYTDSAIYVSHGCSDSLTCEYELKLFLNIGSGSTDACDNKMKDTIAPGYRINAYSWGSIGGLGSPKSKKTECNDNKLRFYIIKENVMRTKSWEQICKNQLYEKKLIFTQAQLDSMCWRITYER